MRLYSYVVRYDFGFAPNPFHGWCTLATCKPGIRWTSSVGDWIIGTGSKSRNLDGHLVYAMRVDEKLTFEDYWTDPRFQRKKPDRRGSKKYRYGDNIYRRDTSGNWRQLDSRHSLADGSQNEGHVARDTGRNAVLASQTFTYWGGTGPELPPDFRNWDGVDLCVPGTGYQWRPLPEVMREAVVDWLSSLEDGCCGDPPDW